MQRHNQVRDGGLRVAVLVRALCIRAHETEDLCARVLFRALIQFWALGYAPTSPDQSPPPFWLSPDGLFGLCELLWVLLLLHNLHKYKAMARRGHEVAAHALLLPAFEPLLRLVVPILVVFIAVVTAMCLIVEEGVKEASGGFMVRAHTTPPHCSLVRVCSAASMPSMLGV